MRILIPVDGTPLARAMIFSTAVIDGMGEG